MASALDKPDHPFSGVDNTPVSERVLPP